jgi:predicted site-specific integrase-resolvase
MTLDYDKALKGYPQYMSLEQMRIACHISKKTARLLLQTGLIPCKNTGKKTHTYKIKKSAVFEYLVQRDIMPERYILPENIYARTSVIPNIDSGTVVPIEFSLLEEYPDVLSVQQAAALSGVTPATVKDWVKKKHLKAFIKNGAYHIPKLLMVEYLQSPRHRRNYSWRQNSLEKRTAKK